MAHNVFLSFAMEDEALVNLFRGQAKNDRLLLEFYDHSVKEPFGHTWKTQCEQKIRRCSVTICLIGEKTHLSEAVNWEIRKSADLGLGIMGVYLVEGQPIRPEALRERQIMPVHWEMDKIMDEIERVAK